MQSRKKRQDNIPHPQRAKVGRWHVLQPLYLLCKRKSRMGCGNSDGGPRWEQLCAARAAPRMYPVATYASHQLQALPHLQSAAAARLVSLACAWRTAAAAAGWRHRPRPRLQGRDAKRDSRMWQGLGRLAGMSSSNFWPGSQAALQTAAVRRALTQTTSVHICVQLRATLFTAEAAGCWV